MLLTVGVFFRGYLRVDWGEVFVGAFEMEELWDLYDGFGESDPVVVVHVDKALSGGEEELFHLFWAVEDGAFRMLDFHLAVIL